MGHQTKRSLISRIPCRRPLHTSYIVDGPLFYCIGFKLIHCLAYLHKYLELVYLRFLMFYVRYYFGFFGLRFLYVVIYGTYCKPRISSSNLRRFSSFLCKIGIEWNSHSQGKFPCIGEIPIYIGEIPIYRGNSHI